MKKYKTKSVLIARKKRENPEDYNHRPCFVSLFDSNDPHLSVEGPKKVIEFSRKHKVVIEGLNNVNYLLPGNDIVINNLTEITVREEGDFVFVSGKQSE
tara:strand:+ start:3458 stop:3754 length:297 start_codon:yes stop_codon:yes gene_type:complete